MLKSKKILSLLLSVVMILSMLPATAMAADSGRAAVSSVVSVDLTTGIPQILYYNSQGKLIACAKLMEMSDTGDTSYSAVAMITYKYSDSGKLTSSDCSFLYGGYGSLSPYYAGYDGYLNFTENASGVLEARDKGGELWYTMDEENYVMNPGNFYTFERDSSGKVSAVKYDSGYGVMIASVTYNENGRITSFANSEGDSGWTRWSGGYAYRYDSEGRMIACDMCNSERKAEFTAYKFTYDANGMVSAISGDGDNYGDFSPLKFTFSTSVSGDTLTVTARDENEWEDWEDVTVSVSTKTGANSTTSSTPTASTGETGGRSSFTDVASTSPYYDAIQWAVAQNITKGTTNTTFSPAGTCTNNHILTFLWRANGSPAATIENPFDNINVGSDFGKAALWAAEQGLVSGTSFPGSTPCTRAQTVLYFWKQAGSPETAVSNQFTDVSADAEYAQAVAWAVEQGITKGTTETTFGPDSTCTRGQIVTFLYRALAN